jgi:lipopolysaccharide export system protein LptC
MKRHISQEITSCLTSLESHKNLSWVKQFHGNKINKVWQEGYHPKAILSEKMFNQKLEYIHNNPILKGFVEKPEYWKYSSARNYMNDDHSIIKLDIDRL